MAKYVITIPDKLERYVLEKYPSFDAYINAMLIDPLFREHEAAVIKERMQPIEDQVKNELQDIRKKIIIKESDSKK